jgi:hypothetical protein
MLRHIVKHTGPIRGNDTKFMADSKVADSA